MLMHPEVKSFLHEATCTYSHLAYDPVRAIGAVIDPVLDYDQRSGRTGTRSADQIVAYARNSGIRVDWILETHAHADHVSAGAYLSEQLGARLAIGAGITKVQSTFKAVFNLGAEFVPDGSQFDHLFSDAEQFEVGAIRARVLATPGHTNDSVTYLIGDAAFIGDTLFAPDTGSARCDFPGGDARVLYRSIVRLFQLPPETRMFLCHDYPPAGRDARPVFELREQREHNVHLNARTTEQAFAAMRSARDKTLDLPNLIIPSIQMNIRAGRKPPAENNGVAYLKFPLDKF